MSKKRKLFDELIQGIEDMRAHREGKITLRTHTVQDLPPLSIDAGLIRETGSNSTCHERCLPAIFACLYALWKTGSRDEPSRTRRLLR